MGASASNSSGMPPELIDAYKKGWSPVFIVPGQSGENPKYVTFKGSTPVQAQSEEELLKAYKEAKGTRRVPLPGRQVQKTANVQPPLLPRNTARNLDDYRYKRGPYNPQVLAAAKRLYEAQQEVPHDDSKLDGAEAMLDRIKKRYHIDKRNTRAEELVERRITEENSSLGPKVANNNIPVSQSQESATKVNLRKNASNRYMGRGPYNPQVMAAAKAYYNAKHSSRFNSGLIGQAKKQLDTTKRVHGVPAGNTRAEDRVEREAVRGRTSAALRSGTKKVGSVVGSAVKGVGSAIGSASSYLGKSGFPFSFSNRNKTRRVQETSTLNSSSTTENIRTSPNNTAAALARTRAELGNARRKNSLGRTTGETVEERFARITK